MTAALEPARPQGWRRQGQDACTLAGHRTRVREAGTRAVSGPIGVQPFPGPQLSLWTSFHLERARGSQVRREEGVVLRAEKW